MKTFTQEGILLMSQNTNTVELLDLKFYANSLEVATVHE